MRGGAAPVDEFTRPAAPPRPRPQRAPRQRTCAPARTPGVAGMAASPWAHSVKACGGGPRARGREAALPTRRAWAGVPHVAAGPRAERSSALSCCRDCTSPPGVRQATLAHVLSQTMHAHDLVPSHPLARPQLPGPAPGWGAKRTARAQDLSSPPPTPSTHLQRRHGARGDEVLVQVGRHHQRVAAPQRQQRVVVDQHLRQDP